MDQSQFTPDMGTAVKSLISVLLTMGMYYLRQHFTAKQIKDAKDIASIAISAVEQYAALKGIKGEDKLSEAILRARGLGKQAGINLSDDKWDSLIHDALAEVKKVWNTTDTTTATAQTTDMVVTAEFDQLKSGVEASIEQLQKQIANFSAGVILKKLG